MKLIKLLLPLMALNIFGLEKSINTAKPILFNTENAATNTPWISSKIVKADATVSASYKEALTLDVNASGFTFSKISGPSWLNIASNGSLTGIPIAGNLGVNNFIVATSNGSVSHETLLTITVVDSKHSRTLAELALYYERLEVLDPTLISNMPSGLKPIIEAILLAEDDIDIGNYQTARNRIQPILDEYPYTDNRWNNFRAWHSKIDNSYFHESLGAPPLYSNLRWLEEITDVALNAPPVETKSLIFTIASMRYASYEIPPQKQNAQGTLPDIIVEIDPSFRLNDYQVYREELNLFSHYIWAITDGEYKLDIQTVEVDNTVAYTYDPESDRLGRNGAHHPVNALPQTIRDASDVFWSLHPDITTDPIFDGIEIFNAGGMSFYGTPNTSYSRGTIFGIASRALNRSYMSRRGQGTRELDHEYYHHFFYQFREFGLENTAHQWFNRSSWPVDFVGSHEADYFSEALNKRFRGASPSLAERLDIGPIKNTRPIWVSKIINKKQAQIDLVYNASLANSVSDIDNNTLQFAKVSGPEWLSIQPDGSITGTPTNTDTGLNRFVVNVNDGFSVAVKTILYIHVEEAICSLPKTLPNFTINKSELDWTSGPILINCASSVTLSMDIEGLDATTLESSDYLNIYYSIDGGDRQILSENNDGFALKTVSQGNIIGNSIEIFIESLNTQSTEFYNITNFFLEEDTTLSSSYLKLNPNAIKIYPNPASGFVTILSQNILGDIKVFYITGKQVLFKTTSEDRLQINTSKLSPGLYFIKVGNLINKLVIE